MLLFAFAFLATILGVAYEHASREHQRRANRPAARWLGRKD